MRVGSNNMEEVKQKINAMKGQNVDFVINKGRNKFVEINALVEKVYPSMFIIKPNNKVYLTRTSYSYSDVLCGEISFAGTKN